MIPAPNPSSTRTAGTAAVPGNRRSLRTIPLLALLAFSLVVFGRTGTARAKLRNRPQIPTTSVAPSGTAAVSNRVEVFVDPTEDWIAYLNLYRATSEGGGLEYRTTVLPSEINAGFQGDNLFVGAMRSHPLDRPLSDTHWWFPDGVGKKQMQSFFYVENDHLAGKTVVFSGTCVSNTFSPSLGFKAEAVVFDYTDDYSGRDAASAPLSPGGNFSVSLRTQPGHHVQYGIWILGPNMHPDQVQKAGRVWVATRLGARILPEPSPSHFANPSFEASRFTNSPGYAADNGGTIPDWILSDPASSGLDVEGGWFANNGAVPNGANVAFLRSRNGEIQTMETTITNLVPDQKYRVGFRANSREGGVEPASDWSINDGDFQSFQAWPPVRGSHPFHMISGEFIATAPRARLVIRNRTGPDSTLLFDDFFVVSVPGIEKDMSQRRETATDSQGDPKVR